MTHPLLNPANFSHFGGAVSAKTQAKYDARKIENAKNLAAFEVGMLVKPFKGYDRNIGPNGQTITAIKGDHITLSNGRTYAAGSLKIA